MARSAGKLKALNIGRPMEPGMYGDGNGLYLQVTATGGKSWIYRYSLQGKAREMGLGALSAVGLADARAKAAEYKRLCLQEVDPIEARKAARAQAKLNNAKAFTFKQAAKAYVDTHSAAWGSSKHSAQWPSTLKRYAEPVFGDMSIQAIDTDLVLRVLKPIWSVKTDTAKRVRQRIEAVLDWAKAHAYRTGENPARWRGHLSNLLPGPSKIRKVKHHPALPYDDLSGFLADVRERDGVGPLALEFTILTAARSGDIIGNNREARPPMLWSHVDLKERVWIVPSTKTEMEHRVPLSTPALALLTKLEAGGKDDPVFPGAKPGKPLSKMSMAHVIKFMNDERKARDIARYVDPKQGGRDVTVHGFRSTFRDWAAERTNFTREVVEKALAHSIENKVEAAYRRGDLLDKRRPLMEEWSKFCYGNLSLTQSVPGVRPGELVGHADIP